MKTKEIYIIILLLLIGEFLIAQNDTINKNENIIYKQYFYKNGKIASEGYLQNDVPTGFWVSYYISGIKKSEGLWRNNKLDSVWVFYDYVGDTSEKISYLDGKKNGYYYEYYKKEGSKNRILCKELFVNGERNGKTYYYYENGNVKQVIPYMNNMKTGEGYEYDKEGNIITINRYRRGEIIERELINRYNDKGVKNGVWKEFYINNVIKEEKNYLNGKLHGFYKTFDKDGKLINAIKYKNGEVALYDTDNETNIEIRDEYNDSGNLIFQGSYNNGKPIGVHRYFNNEGDVIGSKTYDIKGNLISKGIILLNGIRDGNWIYYYPNGNTQSKGSYRRDKKQGEWIYYYSNGRIKQKGVYTAGKLTGNWKWYYRTGELLKEENYIYGKLDGEVIEYTEQGNIIAKGIYIEGLKEGEWIYKIGDQKYIGKYVMDLRDGKWRSYYLEEETVSFEGNYVQGNPDGKHVYYYPNGIIKEEQYYDAGKRVKAWTKYNEYGEIKIVVQYKLGEIYKINGEKMEFVKEGN